jgi:hypothetical protein
MGRPKEFHHELSYFGSATKGFHDDAVAKFGHGHLRRFPFDRVANPLAMVPIGPLGLCFPFARSSFFLLAV